MKKITFPLISLILLSACSININFNDPKNTSTPTQTPQKNPTQTPTLTPKPEVTSEVFIDVENTLEGQLLLYFTDKFNKQAEDVKISVSKNTGTHASGGITFEGEMGGGMWLAYKDASSNWIVVFDGNGTIPCESVESHNFPTTMVPECWDETSQNIKQL